MRSVLVIAEGGLARRALDLTLRLDGATELEIAPEDLELVDGAVRFIGHTWLVTATNR